MHKSNNPPIGPTYSGGGKIGDWRRSQDLDSTIDKIETPDYNYECQNCQQPAEIENVHKKHEPNWCDNCSEMRTFVRIDEE